MKLISYCFFLFYLIGLSLIAQDPQFTQFYAAPMYLNPAFAGADVCSRITSNYRNQWPSIPNGYVTYSFSYDHSIPSISSGVGLLAMSDRAGSGGLSSTSINALYSYELQISRTWSSRWGVQASRVNRSVNFSNLVFGDQIARGGASTSVEFPREKVAFFDISSGLLVYSAKYWFGFATHHLNQPNQSMLDGESPLPIKYSMHSGARFVLREQFGESVSPAINYKGQGRFDQLDIGCYYTHHPIAFGFWYRGIPLFKSYKEGYQNNDAFAILVGMQIQRLNFGYSYDLTVSRLISKTAGSHEMSLSYQFCDIESLKKKKKKAPIIVPCPKF